MNYDSSSSPGHYNQYPGQTGLLILFCSSYVLKIILVDDDCQGNIVINAVAVVLIILDCSEISGVKGGADSMILLISTLHSLLSVLETHQSRKHQTNLC